MRILLPERAENLVMSAARADQLVNKVAASIPARSIRVFIFVMGIVDSCKVIGLLSYVNAYHSGLSTIRWLVRIASLALITVTAF